MKANSLTNGPITGTARRQATDARVSTEVLAPSPPRTIAGTPRAFIVRMREVPMMDATGASKFADFVKTCTKHGTTLIISALQPQPERILRQMRILNDDAPIRLVRDYAEAVTLARALVEATPIEPGSGKTRAND